MHSHARLIHNSGLRGPKIPNLISPKCPFCAILNSQLHYYYQKWYFTYFVYSMIFILLAKQRCKFAFLFFSYVPTYLFIMYVELWWVDSSVVNAKYYVSN